jgi:hypothetical protein
VYCCRQPQGDSYASLLRSPHPRSCCFPPAPLATFPAETSPNTSKLQSSEDPSYASSTAKGGMAVRSDTGRHRSFPSNHAAGGADRRGLLSAFRTEVSRRFWPYVHSYARFFEKSHTKALPSLACTPLVMLSVDSSRSAKYARGSRWREILGRGMSGSLRLDRLSGPLWSSQHLEARRCQTRRKRIVDVD